MEGGGLINNKQIVDICPECFDYKSQREYRNYNSVLYKLNAPYSQLRGLQCSSAINGNFKPYRAGTFNTETCDKFTVGNWYTLG